MSEPTPTMTLEEARTIVAREMGLILNTSISSLEKAVRDNEESIIRHERFGRTHKANEAARRIERFGPLLDAMRILASIHMAQEAAAMVGSIDWTEVRKQTADVISKRKKK